MSVVGSSHRRTTSTAAVPLRSSSRSSERCCDASQTPAAGLLLGLILGA
jgi:hypothetical protein